MIHTWTAWELQSSSIEMVVAVCVLVAAVVTEMVSGIMLVVIGNVVVDVAVDVFATALFAAHLQALQMPPPWQYAPVVVSRSDDPYSDTTHVFVAPGYLIL